MPLLKNCEIWYLKATPSKPNAKFTPDNPTWDIQIRTSSRETKKEWEALKLAVKAIVPDEGAPYYRVNMKRKSIKADGTKASPPDIVNGNLDPVDPETVGHGSIGNVRIFQYTYDKPKPGTASVFMGLQLTKHIVRIAEARDDDFGKTDTEVVSQATKELPGGDEAGDESGPDDDGDF